MASYVARSENITRVIQQMNRLAEATGTIEFHPDLIPALTSGENRPLKWFYYCDDRNGITIRLYDEEFRKQHGRIFQTYETYVILRGKNLGTDRDRTKREMRGLFDELLQPPREINTNNPERALEYFQARNTRDTSPEVATMTNKAFDVTPRTVDDSRYQQLVEETFLDALFFDSLERLLKQHRQVILEGPPGAGKTFVARKFSNWWTSTGSSEAPEGSEVRLVQFHETYGYEDFFQGIKPVLLDAQGRPVTSDTNTKVESMVYQNVNGIFHELCHEAQKEDNKDKRFVLIIDEINRGKMSRIFGELLYLLEYRDEQILLASGESFSIPKNVYLIGTMNTADRSIALVDYALRRRFKFVSLRPWENGDAPVLRRWLETNRVSNGDEIVALFCKLNERISEINEHLVVGHSYFMLPELAQDNSPSGPYPAHRLEEIWQFSIMPLLAEYQPHLSSNELEKVYGLTTLMRELPT